MSRPFQHLVIYRPSVPNQILHSSSLALYGFASRQLSSCLSVAEDWAVFSFAKNALFLIKYSQATGVHGDYSSAKMSSSITDNVP